MAFSSALHNLCFLLFLVMFLIVTLTGNCTENRNLRLHIQLLLNYHLAIFVESVQILKSS